MLKTRILTALVLLAGFLSALFLLPALGWVCFVAVVCALAAWEWGGLARLHGAGRALYSVTVGLACLGVSLLAGFAGGRESVAAVLPVYALSVLFWVACVPMWLRRQWSLGAAGPLVGLVVLVPTGVAMAHLRQLGPWLLLAAMSTVWMADIAAYFVGRAWGRHKLAPTISPGKSWEGAFGAAVAVPLYGLGLSLAAVPHRMPAFWYAGLGVALLGYTAISVIGDLFESLLKRKVGIKDSGALLPGHGGILDRIDSLTSTLPLAGLLALWYFS